MFNRWFGLGALATLVMTAGCTERLPKLPADNGPGLQDLTAYIEGDVLRGVDGQAGTVPMPKARVEVLGVGSSLTGPTGRFRLPRVKVGLEDQTLEFLVYDQTQGVDAMPVSRYQYELLAGTSGQVKVDITIGARGSIKGRVALPEGSPPGGVIVFVEGVPGADDLSGPQGHFFLHGVPEGAVRVGFMYEDYVVAPQDLIDVMVSPYQATEIPETIQLTPPPGESALAPVTVMVDRHPDVPAEDLEVVISPLLARPWSGSPAEGAEPVKVIPVPADGRLDLAFDYPEPHTVVLRQRAGTSARPIRFARRVYVRPGDAPIHFNAGFGVASDESGQDLGIDTDGDGVADAQDDDPDGDGCTNEPELTALDPYSCGDGDGDGVADGFDPDDDGDGMPDLEELTPGSDGRTSDHREDEGQNIPPGNLVASADGVVAILGEGTVNQRTEADEFRTLIDRHHATFGNTLVTPIYEVQADTTSDPKLLVQLFGYRGDEETLRLVVGSQTNPSWLNERELPGVNLDCEDVGRGRKTCPVDALRQDLDGEAYLVFVSTSGATVTPLCGNGQVEGDEECDDGNLVDTDSCLTNCRTARCGDSFVHADVEACDDGNMSNDDACVGDQCAVARCGDGYVRADLADDSPDFEACDDGNDENPEDGCHECQNPRCGDGVVTEGEECDDGNVANTDSCTSECRPYRCGDGYVNLDLPGNADDFEGCDDGNDDDNDGCRNNCLKEMLPGRLVSSAFGGCRRTVDGYWSCWGLRTSGQFGAGDGLWDPTGTPSGLSAPTTLVAGANHYCALTGDGLVSCWGDSSSRQAGTQSNQALTPVALPLAQVTSLSAGHALSCATKIDGSTYCWGALDADNLTHVPQRVAAGQTTRRLFSVLDGVCGQRGDGSVWCQGNNVHGSLGTAQQGMLDPQVVSAWGRPAQMQGSQWAQTHDEQDDLACAIGNMGGCHNHTCALTQNGMVVCAGNNAWGQVENSGTNNVREPVVNFNGAVRQVAVGGYHTCVLDYSFERNVYCWGYNGAGQLGFTADQERHPVPRPVPELTGVEEVVAGALHTCVLIGQDEVRCFGSGDQGQLGNEVGSTHLPQSIEGLWVGRQPVFNSERPMLGRVGDEYVYTPNVVDEDGDPLTVDGGCLNDDRMPLTPPAVVVNGTLRFTPAGGGTLHCELQASDGTGRHAKQSWNFELRTADQNVDPIVCSEADEDQDGFTNCGEDDVAGTADDDCDDNNAGINPNAFERCDQFDNNCNGWIDEICVEDDGRDRG
jgi:cysteine-rich repeat protein